MSTVVCTSSHPVDLPDGRSLAPGETAEDIDTKEPSVKDLVLDGHLNVLEGTTPRTRPTPEATIKAATESLDTTGD